MRSGSRVCSLELTLNRVCSQWKQTRTEEGRTVNPDIKQEQRVRQNKESEINESEFISRSLRCTLAAISINSVFYPTFHSRISSPWSGKSFFFSIYVLSFYRNLHTAELQEHRRKLCKTRTGQFSRNCSESLMSVCPSVRETGSLYQLVFFLRLDG